MHVLLTTVHGRAWDDGRGIREQDGWDEHAAFTDSLVRDGLVVVGALIGPGRCP